MTEHFSNGWGKNTLLFIDKLETASPLSETHTVTVYHEKSEKQIGIINYKRNAATEKKTTKLEILNIIIKGWDNPEFIRRMLVTILKKYKKAKLIGRIIYTIDKNQERMIRDILSDDIKIPGMYKDIEGRREFEFSEVEISGLKL